MEALFGAKEKISDEFGALRGSITLSTCELAKEISLGYNSCPAYGGGLEWYEIKELASF